MAEGDEPHLDAVSDSELPHLDPGCVARPGRGSIRHGRRERRPRASLQDGMRGGPSAREVENVWDVPRAPGAGAIRAASLFAAEITERRDARAGRRTISTSAQRQVCATRHPQLGRILCVAGGRRRGQPQGVVIDAAGTQYESVSVPAPVPPARSVATRSNWLPRYGYAFPPRRHRGARQPDREPVRHAHARRRRRSLAPVDR